MNLTKNHYIILVSSTSILLLIGGIFYYTHIQSQIQASYDDKTEKFNSLTPVSGTDTSS